MKNYAIIIPSFNDWDCLNILIPKVDQVLKGRKEDVSILIVNDGSTKKNNLVFQDISYLKKIEVLNLKKNVKAQIAIATGLSFLKSKKFQGGIVVMDADGQDNPDQLIEIIEISKKNPEKTITINRTSREDELLFKIFYYIYICLTFLLTFKNMKFGVYSYIHYSSLNKILSTSDIQMAYAASIAKHFKHKTVIYAPRKKRVHGESQNNYISLINYALKIISVFKYNVLINSICLLLIFFLFLKFKFFILFFLIFVFFNIIIFILPFKTKILSKENILLNIENIENQL